MSAVSWGLLGHGNIGGELARQVSATYKRLGLKQTPEFILRSSGLKQADNVTPHKAKSLDKLADFPKVIFVTLPSTENGEPSFELIKHCLDKGALVITSEKGAMANSFSQLKKLSNDFKRLGVNATVGGGTRVMELAQSYLRDPSNITQMHLSLNGTLTAIFSSVGPSTGSGMSVGQAVQQAVMLGYAEPGATDSIDVIRSEAEGDIPKKVSIFINQSGLLGKKILNWRQLRFKLTEKEVSLAIEEAKIRRFIVSLYPTKNSKLGPEKHIIGGFSVTIDGWKIIGGFRNVELNPLLQPLGTLGGPGNGMVIGLGPNETDGVYSVVGPGAGPGPTANTMLDDYDRLR